MESGLRRRVFWRSLALQASWHPERMQNLGLLFAVLPWLRRTGPSAAAARRFSRRHYGFFNTNPFLSGYLIGGLIRLEEENLRSGGAIERTVGNFKESLGRALASLGDQLFWLGLQPALLMLAAAGVLAGLGWTPLLLLIIGAALVGLLRWRSLDAGYRLGMDIVDLLDRPVWHRSIRLANRLGMLAGGACLGLYVVRVARGGGAPDPAALGAVTAAAFAAGLLLRRRLPGELAFLLLAPLALALARI